MSRKFDDAVDTAWGRFEEQLGESWASAPDGYMEIVPAVESEQDVPLVTVDWDEEELEAELIGLSADRDVKAIAALGWQLPEDPATSPFWRVILPRDQGDVLAGLMSSTLRHVFGVTDPAFLQSFDSLATTVPPQAPRDAVEAPDEAGEQCDQEPVMGYPSNADELVEMVEQALAVTYGPEVLRDPDGDFPINTGVVPLWVHVQDDAPMVRLFSFVVRSVRDLRQAKIEVGILNRRTSLLKFTLEDAVVVATYDLPAAPFVGPQLLHAIERISELLNELAADSATRVNGKLWFDDLKDAAAGPDREELA